MANFRLFQTPIGLCGIAWDSHGIVRTALPGRSEHDTRRALEPGVPFEAENVPEGVAVAVRQIQHLLSGGADDLRSIALDWSKLPEFDARVYALTRQIGPGQTSSYGAIAGELGDALLARSVGQALGRNPWPIIVPCHRILAAGGTAGGFSAPGGLTTKRKILAIESVHAQRDGDLFMN